MNLNPKSLTLDLEIFLLTPRGRSNMGPGGLKPRPTLGTPWKEEERTGENKRKEGREEEEGEERAR